MFRLVVLLCGTIFLVMLIGGRDSGQLRFGLMPQAAAPVVQQVAASVEATGARAPEVVEASFVPTRPVMAVAEPEDVAAPVTAIVTEVASAEVALPEVPAGRVLFVAARSLNVRSGPGTGHPVVETLARDEAVLVVVEGEGPDGWARIRIEGDGVEGYVAARLLRE